MGDVSFVMTPEEVQSFKESTFVTHGARLDGFEGLYCAWATDPAAARHILPPPLQLAAPVVTTYIARIADANYAAPYMEAGIGVPAMYKETMGLYFAAFLLTGPGAQMATYLGRDGGIPKKLADDIQVIRSGDNVTAFVERGGVRIIEVRAEIGDYNTPEAAQLFAGMSRGGELVGANYLFKYDLGQGTDGHTELAGGRLRRSTSRTTFKSWQPASATITLKRSPDDPWAELVVSKALGAGFTHCDMHLVADEDVEEVDMARVQPYLLKGRYDTHCFTR